MGLSLKDRIHVFEKFANTNTEKEVVKLQEYRTELEENIVSCQTYLNSNHIAKIVENREPMLKKIQNNTTRYPHYPRYFRLEGEQAFFGSNT